MRTNTQISSEIDLTADGHHAGYLHLPHSVHRSAYGWLPVPIVSIKNGEGPCVLLMAGNHGDEYEGQIVLCELARNLGVKDIKGQIIILPMANYPAAKAGRRTSPIDEGNLNRSFPGDAHGNLTQMLAHFIEEELLPDCDYLLDLHSGGSSLIYDPAVLMQFAATEKAQQFNLSLMNSLGFPNGLFFPPEDHGNYSSSAARRKNAIPITVEVAGGGTVDASAAKKLRFGLRNYLALIGVLPGHTLETKNITRIMQVVNDDYYCYATAEGLFEAAVMLCDEVKTGQLAGWIHFPCDPMRAPSEVFFSRNGVVVCKRQPAMVQHGDCLFHLATYV